MKCRMRHLNIMDMLRDIGKDNDDRQGFMVKHWLEVHATEETRAHFDQFVEQVNAESRMDAISRRNIGFAADRK